MMNTMKPIILGGGSGFLGQLLTKHFQSSGQEVVILTRAPARVCKGARAVEWDGETLGEWTRELENSAALINLAGRSVNCRYHRRNRRDIMNSRIHSTHVLGKAIQQCKHPPAVWLNSSTATIYKHSYDRPNDEAGGVIGATPEAKDDFSIEVATAWEREFEKAATSQMRKITLRAAMVLDGAPGTVFRVLRRLVLLGLGGAMGNGRQYMSWIHSSDFCRAIEWLINNPDARGIYNICSPNPIPNRQLMKALRDVCGMPFGLPATKWMLEVGAYVLRTETELVIKSRRVVPTRLLAEGFSFEFPRIEKALAHLNHKNS